MPIKPYLQLIRLPNVFTAGADSLAGWLLVGSALSDGSGWLPLFGASLALYAGGVALNDYFDYEIDLRERPKRPLPSGRVSLRFALGLSVLLIAVGLGLVAVGGSWKGLLVAVLLASCIVAYDAGLKRTILGPELMGSCRGLNVLLGMSVAENLGGPWAWLVAGSMALFVVGVTWISRSETESGQTAGTMAGVALQNLAILGLIVAALEHSQFPAPLSDRPILPLEGLLVLLIVGSIVNLAGARAIRTPEPATLQAAVKTGVLSLVWLHVGVLAAVRGPGPALVLILLWIPAFVLGRWLYST
jgi:4-hydroxybenzoate polyprenyltransferase